MLSVWIDFGLKMRGLNMRVFSECPCRPTTTRTMFKLVNLLFGKLGAKGSD